MGIYSFLNRSAKKDERITELEAQVIRLTDQNSDISERLDMAHEVEVSQAETIKTQKEVIEQLQTRLSVEHVDHLAEMHGRLERIRELEHDAAEYDVKEIEAIAAENSDLVAFVRKCVA